MGFVWADECEEFCSVDNNVGDDCKNEANHHSDLSMIENRGPDSETNPKKECSTAVQTNSDDEVQPEVNRRQQSCWSRASMDSQRSISFFVDFDDCDIDGKDNHLGIQTCIKPRYTFYSTRTTWILLTRSKL